MSSSISFSLARLCLLRALSVCKSVAPPLSRAGAFAEEEDEILEEFRFDEVFRDIRFTNLMLVSKCGRPIGLMWNVIVSRRLTIGLICVGYWVFYS